MKRGKFKVTQRKKKDRLTVSCGIPLSTGESLSLTIRALPNDWDLLYNLSVAKPDLVGNLIYLHFANPAHEIIDRNAARGIHQGREEFLKDAKIWSIAINTYVKYWLQHPPRKWPSAMKEDLNEIEAKAGKLITRKGKPDPIKITAYIMEKYYGKKRRSHGLKKWSDDIDGFRRTYLMKKPTTEYYSKMANHFAPQSISLSPQDFSKIIRSS